MVKKYQKAGFTLIEVVTALFIVGLLMLLMLPNINRIKAIANQYQASAMQQTIRGQINLFELAHPDDLPVTKEKLIAREYLTQEQGKRMLALKLEIDDNGDVNTREKK
ncbi:prepilin-type N-terminal cleavage/methylation domain-containing protein [Weissella diestrammenae]|uniref:Prepilin-type N-terminal cleavage/methylation domain-containing protein n=1 Tax=Weissella diestrammenae TaxID=1162633 RepID=A0A7G9T4Z9_9LACO|nr:prepilin-type N-terminal cleavage/methylation domain-containing protein [Weissella diestrammenae]MCM0582896.1 prepilin-type N-terminal cleavage/methylation domain-containing protein [Weissella diestrammenae]QNN75174.1 prepilin-type N-terminal cleavage/methylation domain-containing protein [Weissella diestrammenae]